MGVNAISAYAQFADDFINSELIPNCHRKVVCMKVHNVNIHRLINLFRNNEALVRKYFDKDNFTDSDSKALISELLSHENGATTTLVYQSNSDSANILPTFECDLNSEQIAIITEAVNKAHVFTNTVTDTEIRELFSCTLIQPLKANKIRKVVTVFHALMVEGVIQSDWQKILGDRGYILSPSTNKPLKRSNFSSALNEIPQDGKRGNDIIRKMAREVARIKENGQKEVNDIEKT